MYLLPRLFVLLFCLTLGIAPASGQGREQGITEPTPDMAQELLKVDGPVTLQRVAEGVPGWNVYQGGGVVGHIASSSEVAGSVGYSGQPLDVLVAVSPMAVITGARLVHHNEPVLTLGISDADIARYVSGFAGLDLTAPESISANAPDVISRATVSTGVIRDGILRTARTIAIARGLIRGAGIDRISFTPLDWVGLQQMNAVAETQVSMTAAAAALAGAKVPVQPGDGDFLRLYAAIIDTPTVGQNLLGQQQFTRIIGGLGAGQSALMVASAGLQSHRGTAWRRSGVFDRLTIVQGNTRWQPGADSYTMIESLVPEDAPAMKEVSLFALPPTIDPTVPFLVEVTATRPSSGADIEMIITLPYSLPETFHLAAPEAAPLWHDIWMKKRPEAVIVVVMLTCLTLILFAQGAITRRPKLWLRLRLGFLLTTFLVLGMGLNGQLSVVQVVAFLHALLTGFRWETFLADPVIFLLWGFTALGLLFWGRGVYCGWLCPFGALQELTNAAAQRLGIRQIAVPQGVHERLWVIKYTLFVVILAMSFYSMHDAILLAEVEPFKTAISMRFIRAWPFVLFVLLLLGAGLFIERFFCRYLCPLGAGLAIPAKLKIFDWLRRRPQCGRECRLCETKCTVGAIDPLGRINPNECVLCLRCQVIMADPTQCPVLKRRARTS
ncbi:4Fe-4S binding protein [Pseudorhodobacter aquimaris]|uniref:4Fe-4S binding protein n=1 Tax=Pseudorhodobacter aquimaris TaxID=687412 RepID=UPI00067B98F5|nr:4Fe-4S binding protein [Pseudorhodobacter aquimaris]